MKKRKWHKEKNQYLYLYLYPLTIPGKLCAVRLCWWVHGSNESDLDESGCPVFKLTE